MLVNFQIAPAVKPEKLVAALSVFALLLVFDHTPGRAQTATFQVIAPLSGNLFASASAISPDGSTVVGSSFGTPPQVQPQAIEWTASGGTVGLGYVSGLTASSYALAVSGALSQGGAAIFGGSENSTPTVEAFSWTQGGGMTSLSFPSGELSNLATGSSYDGTVVVGWRLNGSSNVVAFRWTAATGLVSLGTLPGDDTSSASGVSADGSTVVGVSENSTTGAQQAFVWTQAGGMVGLGYLPSDTISVASAANADGSVVVGMSGTQPSGTTPPPQVLHAFRWTAATGMVNLGTLSGDTGAVANAVSSNGNVVVGQSIGQGVTASEPYPYGVRAFVWTASTGMQPIQDLLTGYGTNLGEIYFLSSATGISGGGSVIIGTGCGYSYVGGNSYPCSDTPWVSNLTIPGVARTNTHDFNGDNKSDILWRDTSGDVAIWEMNGTAILNASSSFVATVSPTTWSIVGQCDFNGDGKADLLWRDTAGDVAIWEMNGTTVLNGSSSYVATVSPATWTIVGTGDFFGTGKCGILWRDTSGDVAIWEMKGTTILNASTSYVATVSPSTWTIYGVGDFNGDGNADILWQDTSGDVAIWEMSGTRIVNASSSYVATVSPSSGWSIAGTGDFNGDGMSDILWHDSAGDVAIWEMSGTTILNPSSSYVATVSPSVWSIVQTGDFYGIGMSGILWQDTSGDVVIWEINGTAISNSSSTYVATVPRSTWTIQTLNSEGPP
jgi:probable HAF family extracellular repeat protein